MAPSLANGCSPTDCRLVSSILRKLKAQASENQSRIPFSKRVEPFSTTFIQSSVPFHSSYLRGAVDWVASDIQRLGLTFSGTGVETLLSRCRKFESQAQDAHDVFQPADRRTGIQRGGRRGGGGYIKVQQLRVLHCVENFLFHILLVVGTCCQQLVCLSRVFCWLACETSSMLNLQLLVGFPRCQFCLLPRRRLTQSCVSYLNMLHVCWWI